jgi:acyl-CoA synthetase (AMP-forming)/AMP-acid ligase II
MMKHCPESVNWGSAFATLAQRFERLPAVCTQSAEHTFDEVLGRAAAVAHSLRSDGIEAGQPVATVLTNRAHAVWGSIGVTLTGAAEASLNAAMTAAELKYCLDLIEPRRILANDTTATAVREAGYSPLLVEEIDDARADIAVDRPVDGDVAGKILFTSGTTGKPKAVIHSHRGRWIANLMLRSNLPFQPTPQSRILLMTPYSHGASLLTGAFLDTGASVHLMTGVDVAHIRALLASGAVDCMFAPPTVLAKLTESLSGLTCRSLRTIFTGTATLPSAVYRRTRAIFGPIVRITYGKTEIFNPITVLEPDDTDAAYAKADESGCANLGWPVSGVEVSIRDDSDGICPVGTAGRIFLRAPHMMAGYIDETGVHSVTPQDWHESGDVGALSPRGELLLVGREKDVIKTGGYKLFPQEVEAPLVAGQIADDVAVVGLPSAYWGQIVAAVAERPAPGWEARAAAAVGSLSRYKRPRAYISVLTLPRNAQGKLQRPKLLEMLLAEYCVEDGPHPVVRRRR